MPQENTNPAAKTDSSEFEFEAPQPDNPRLKKRNLKAAAQAAGAQASRPAAEPARPAVYAQPAAATHSTPSGPAYARPSGTDQRPQPAPATGVLYYSSTPTSPKRPEAMKAPLSPSQATRLASGAAQAASHSLPQRSAAAAQAATRTGASSASAQARPATSSASTQPRPASSYSQRPASTQQTAPTRPASTTHTPVSQTSHSTSHSTHASSAARPASSGASTSRPASSAAAAAAATQQTSRAVSTHVASPASRPAGVTDFRANIERQSREQKSVGNILNIFVYGLAAFLVLGAVLAAYGAHDVYKQLHAQSTTVTELDSRYSAANQTLTDALKANTQATQQVQLQLAKAQELILRQQDALTKLQGSLDAQGDALRQERNTRAAETSIRAQETSALRSRIRTLEAKNEPYRP